MSIIVNYGHFAGTQGEDLKVPANPEIEHLSWVLSWVKHTRGLLNLWYYHPTVINPCVIFILKF